MCQENFEFSKSRDTWDRTLVDENICKMSIWYLEKRLSFDILNAQKGNFLRYLRGFRHFSEYHILSDLGSSKSVLGSFLVFLTKICPKNMHHTVQTHNYTFDLFSISWPWMTLIWHKVTKDLGGYLEVSQIRSMSFYRLYFNLIRLLCPAKPTMPDCLKKIDVGPDLWRHQWPLDKMLHNIRKVLARSYQIPFSDRESGH